MDMDIDPQLPLPNPRNAALSYLLYDEYRLADGEVHAEDMMPIDEFVMYWHMVHNSRDHMRADEHGFVYFPGERDHSLNLTVATDRAKRLAWSIINAVAENDKDGICFGPFGWDDIVVSRRTGKALFRDVAIIRDLSRDELDRQLQVNYVHARDIIQQMFVNSVPEDIVDLLGLMQNFNDRPLFRMHGSLVPMANHSGLFKEIYDTVMLAVPVAVQHAILLAMRAAFPDYMARWKTEVTRNTLLNATFTFQGGKSYFALPSHPNTAQQKLSKDERILLGHLRIVPQHGKKFLDQNELDLMEPLQLVLFLRNRPAHRMERYEEFVLNHADEDFNSLGSERVSHARFPMVLVFLQYELYWRGYHNRIPALPMFY